MKNADKNKDGFISEAEFLRRLFCLGTVFTRGYGFCITYLTIIASHWYNYAHLSFVFSFLTFM